MINACGSCSKTLLFIFNVIFWLSGLAIIGVGVWMLVDKSVGDYFEVLNLETHDKYYKYAAYILIAVGGFVLLVGFCGCYGASKESKCLLGMYIVLLVIVFLGEIAAGIVMVIYKLKFEDQVDDVLKKSLKEQYSQDDYTSVTHSWNIVQIQLDCCGVNGPDDYANSFFANDTQKKLPTSCCVLKNKANIKDDTCQVKPVDELKCIAQVSDFHKQGCKDGLVSWAKKHSGILIGVGFGVGALQIIGIIAAICLCRQIGQNSFKD